MRWLRLIAILAALAPAGARAATTPWVGDARGSARLITAVQATGSSARLDAALELRLAPGWHTYWRTPGDAGLATTIDWQGSDNLADAAMAWPAPERLIIGGLQNFVYRDRVVLPIRLTLARPGEALRLHAEVDYASCDKVCIPYHAALDLALPTGLAAPGPEAPLIAEAATKVPGSLAAAGLTQVSATIARTGSDASLAVSLASEGTSLHDPDLFVEGIDDVLPRPRVQLAAGGRSAVLSVPLSSQAADAITGHQLTFTVVDGGRSAEFTAAPVPAAGLAPQGGAGLLAIIGVAFLGGLILNAMPCVLPVLSLKLLVVAGRGGAERRRVRLELLASAAGVVASFLAIAMVLIALKRAGLAVGWGIQFQQPWFLAGMALLMTLFAASLWDLIAVGLPGVALAASVRSRHPMLDAFLAGAFATLMASSCSAPFVGTAVGFALARGPEEIVPVFLALGIGMAAPMLAVVAVPGLVRALPRPGPWMTWLRQALGFALAATSIWLLWVLAQLAGTEAALAASLALLVLIAALALRRKVSFRRAGTAIAYAASLAAVLAPSFTPEGSLHTGAAAETASGRWLRFDPDAIRREVAAGRIVFVDVTAAWCLTCKLNETAVLGRAPVADRLRAPDVVVMRADWTRPEPAITAYLQSFARYGVPLNVVYGPARPDGDALPELLSASAVLDALARAAGPTPRTVTER